CTLRGVRHVIEFRALRLQKGTAKGAAMGSKIRFSFWHVAIASALFAGAGFLVLSADAAAQAPAAQAAPQAQPQTGRPGTGRPGTQPGRPNPGSPTGGRPGRPTIQPVPGPRPTPGSPPGYRPPRP